MTESMEENILLCSLLYLISGPYVQGGFHVITKKG